MNCEQAWEWMMARMDGEAAEQTALEAHLPHCAACRETWERLQVVDRLLRGAPMTTPPLGFAGRTLARLDRRRRARRTLTEGLLLAAAAVVAAALTVAPTAWALPNLVETVRPLLWTGVPVITRLMEAAWTLLRSICLTADALTPRLLPLALAGLLAAALANLLWLRIVWRIQPAASRFVRR